MTSRDADSHADRSEGEGPPPPHVLMIVANDVTADTRVRKMAHDLARAGPRVTVLGFSTTGRREEVALGSALLIRLPYQSFRGTIPRSLPSRLRPTSPHLLSKKVAGARDSFFLHQNEVGAEIGWMRQNRLDRKQERFASLNNGDRRRREKLAERRAALTKRQGSVTQWIRPLGVSARRGFSLIIRMDRLLALGWGSMMKRWVLGSDRLRARTMIQMEKRIRKRLKRRERRYLRVTEKWTNRMLEQADPDQHLRPDSVSWRRELPELYDYELTFFKEIEKQEPDVVHVHDIHLLGVAARAVARRSVGGRDTKLVYDSHEYVQGLSRYSKRTLAAWVDLEQEYFHRADRVITVSPPLADLLARDYDMTTPPVLILNIPSEVEPGNESVRDAAGLDEGVPLLVYSGGMDPTRGVHTLVKAVGLLDGVHLALVTKGTSGYVQELETAADEGGYGERLHVVPFVDPQNVVSYLSSADVAVHPMVAGYMNHEIALPNKIFEYMHAGLPMVVSDCRAMSELVTKLGIGEKFRSEDPASLAEATRIVLDDRTRYHDAYVNQPDLLHRYSWASQVEKLLDLYEDLIGIENIDRDAVEAVPKIEKGDDRPTLLIGPRNMAGQAWEWAQAMERSDPSISTYVLELIRPEKLQFQADLRVPSEKWRNLDWQIDWARKVAGNFTHVLLESGSGILGNLNGGRLLDDVGFLRQRGIKVGVVLHGSEARDPRIHRRLVSESPFQRGSALSSRLEASATSVLGMVHNFEGSVFVATLDLLDYVPDATWLPITVSAERWNSPPFSATVDKPLRVLFAPTNPELKGGVHVEEVGNRLQAEGVVDLKIVSNVPPDQMPDLVAWADALIDGVVLGQYGTTAVEAMAAGRVVLANISRVQDRLPEMSPIVHVTPNSLEDTLRSIAQDPEKYRAHADSGPGYVSRFHDGRFAATQLAEFLGI